MSRFQGALHTGPTGLMLSADNIFVANGSDTITTASFDPLPMLSTINVNGTSLTLASPGVSILTVGTYYRFCCKVFESKLNFCKTE
ncbi:hypothetical protein ACT7C9_32350 [Bacillus cereus]